MTVPPGDAHAQQRGATKPPVLGGHHAEHRALRELHAERHLTLESRRWAPIILGGGWGSFIRAPTPFFSISPEILKPIRRERRVANRRSNRPVAKIVLDRSGVPPIVGQ